jgi:hypothetical protein
MPVLQIYISTPYSKGDCSSFALFVYQYIMESNMGCLIASFVSTTSYLARTTPYVLGGVLRHFCYPWRTSIVLLYLNLLAIRCACGLWRG